MFVQPQLQKIKKKKEGKGKEKKRKGAVGRVRLVPLIREKGPVNEDMSGPTEKENYQEKTNIWRK